jgi:putative membrane protein
MRQLKQVLALAVLAVATVALTAGSAGSAPAQTPTERAGVYEAHWLRAMAQSDIFEIASGRLALARSQTAPVRQIADMLVAEHTAALQRKRALGKTLRVALPERTSPLQTMLLNQLYRTADAAPFEQLFVRTQLAAHQQAILISGEATRAPVNARVRNYAKASLPALKEHLRSARAAARALGIPEGGPPLAEPVPA